MNRAIQVVKGIADPTRTRIVAALRKRDLCVCELCDALEISQSTLSTHLALLRDSGVVQTRKEGKWIYYALAPDLMAFIDAFFQHFDEIVTHRRIRRDEERVKKRLKLRERGSCVRGFDQLNKRTESRAA